MKKFLFILMVFGFVGSAFSSVVVNINEAEFDRLLDLLVRGRGSVTIIEHSHAGYNYLFFKDGFYYNLRKQYKKVFESNAVRVIPASLVTIDNNNYVHTF